MNRDHLTTIPSLLMLRELMHLGNRVNIYGAVADFPNAGCFYIHGHLARPRGCSHYRIGEGAIWEPASLIYDDSTAPHL